MEHAEARETKTAVSKELPWTVPSGTQLAFANGIFSLAVVVLGSISISWRPQLPEWWAESGHYHTPTYVLQSFEIVFSVIIMFYEMCCASKPHVSLTFSGLASSTAAAIALMAQVLHKTSPRNAGMSMFKDMHDVDDPYPYPARILSHQGLDRWYEWTTLVIVFGAQITCVIFSVTLSTLRWVGGDYLRNHRCICFLDCNAITLHIITTIATAIHEQAHWQAHKSDVLAHMMVFYVLFSVFLALPLLSWCLIAGAARHWRRPDRAAIFNRPVVLYTGALAVMLLVTSIGWPYDTPEVVITVSVCLAICAFPCGMLVAKRAHSTSSDRPGALSEETKGATRMRMPGADESAHGQEMEDLHHLRGVGSIAEVFNLHSDKEGELYA